MAVSKGIEDEIRANRRVIARLKREIFGVDKTHKSRYIREFQSEFRSFRSIARAGEVIDEASRRDIVYFGDYHPLDASQDWVLRLMKELSARGRKVVLALEMLYVHQQDSLDRWMKGTIGEAQFLDAIDYRSEWGFDWRSYRRIFELAKDPFIPIFGIDSEHRDHLKFIRRRDRLAAQRIGTIRKFFPEHLILVVIGESHLASNHLP
ncbi:MAG: ChaN family lipoprotein, partial [Candidatus Krumholzibacteria bacterium]|nr:ChaN family lipoprotein [Candidatus Krumholzibacteria bacterium]